MAADDFWYSSMRMPPYPPASRVQGAALDACTIDPATTDAIHKVTDHSKP